MGGEGGGKCDGIPFFNVFLFISSYSCFHSINKWKDLLLHFSTQLEFNLSLDHLNVNCSNFVLSIMAFVMNHMPKLYFIPWSNTCSVVGYNTYLTDE